ncbi:unnamed protein product [Sphagnum troendelagicum]|uniref:Uncharacterized protein n=1 Tax=Sphagnum troendelagicum TaxID=128251 RepID=A0ABP0T7S2_9BRYO
MGGIGAGKKAVGASSACPRSADCPRDCPRVRSSAPAFKKGSFALLFPNTNSFSSSQESQFFSQHSKFRATDSVPWCLLCTFRRSLLVALNKGVGDLLIQDLERKAEREVQCCNGGRPYISLQCSREAEPEARA